MCETEEGSGAPLQLAPHETFDQAWGSVASPGEPELRRHLSAWSLISGWQEVKTAAHFLLLCWSVIGSRGGGICVIKEECTMLLSAYLQGRHSVSLEIGLSPQLPCAP